MGILEAPQSAEFLGAPRLPALARLSAGSQLGVITGLIPAVKPAAGEAADRPRRLQQCSAAIRSASTVPPSGTRRACWS
jgi:hypothetical protein